MTPVVVTDFDGVLTTAASWRAAWPHDRDPTFAEMMAAAPHAFDAACIARLQRLCDATGASVAVCSAWRGRFDAPTLASMLRDAGLTAPVLGSVGGVRFSGETRMDGVWEWLDEHAVSRFVVIDDEGHRYSGEPAYLDLKPPRGYVEAMMPHRGHVQRVFLPEWLAGRLVVPVGGLTDDDVTAALRALEIDREVSP